MLLHTLAAHPLLCVLAAGSLLLLAYGLHPIQRWRLCHIPGPTPLPFIGNLGDIFRDGFHRVWGKWGRKYGHVYKVWWGATPAVVVSDPQAARLILLKNPERFRLPAVQDLQRGVEAQMQELGLASVNDKDKHRDIKNAWLPVFNSASLEASNALINRCVEHMCDNLTAVAREGRETNIWRDDFGKMTMDVVGTVAFGVDFHTQDNDSEENSEEAQRLIQAAQAIFSQSPFVGNMYVAPLVMFPALKPLMRLLSSMYPDPSGKPVRNARAVLQETTIKLVREARAQQAAAGGKPAAGAAVGAGAAVSAAPDQAAGAQRKSRAVQPGSFLALMMGSKHEKSGEPFSDVNVLAQAFTFLLAGYETTGTALGFTLYCLAAHPDKAAKLAQEVDREAPKGDVGAAQLARMPYADACLREGMRLYPPATLVSRALAEATTVRGYALPKGVGVMVPVIEIHRDPAVYSRPDDFVPERWLEGVPEHAADAHAPGAWLTFGEGMRVCVGQRLALNEAKITLAHLFRRFTFKLSPGQVPLEVESPLLLRPKHGVFVTPVLRTEE